MRKTVATLCGLALLAATTSAARAESVSINGKTGQGFVASYNNICYVFLPHHVHGPLTSLSLATGAPASFGQARVKQTFAPGMDLSVGFVTGGLEGACAARFDALPGNIDRIVTVGDPVTIATVSEAGRIEGLRATVIDTSFDNLTLELLPSVTASISKGRSGSLVLAGDKPVGMLLQAGPDGRTGYALRIDAIVDRTGRFVTGAADRPGAERSDAAGPDPQPPAEAGRGLGGLAERIAACSFEGATPENTCWNIGAPSAHILASPADLPISVTIDLSGDKAAAVSGVRLAAQAETDAWTVPRSVLVEFASGPASRPQWRRFGGGDMTPDGVLEIVNGMAPRTTMIRLTVRSAWTEGLPIRLDGVEIR